MHVSMVTAGLLGLLLIALGIRVVAVRRSAGVLIGDGGNAELLSRIRAHANCTEYAPLGLLLVFLNEQAFGPTWFVITLAALLVLGRLLHPVGMAKQRVNRTRAIAMVLTWTSMGLMAILLLLQSISWCEACVAGR
jgi:uncharacterized membrane protein YecN with MAPEG domain